ncbi:protein TIFY 10A-like isoform X2 [Durio zibethinus]|uniref:Protein TIFY n=1 Tax=Durio zibethinus TaxID=66656 RepID=A0A6P5ZC87_DURZI|nr:protein TIFY 10A-like isoform X2 [Durio zibethinus]
MSCSPEFMGQKPVRSPEKPSFSQTCNLLSQYLKKKGSFGDLTLGMTCNVEGKPEMLRPTMNLFPVNPMSGDVCGRNVGAPRNLRSMGLFPQQAGFSAPASKDDGLKRDDSSVTSLNKSAAVEPQTAQMTIFYGGQVIVFNDFPADKAKEIMLLASNGSSQSNNFNPNPAKTNAPFTSSRAGSPIESGVGVRPTLNVVPNFRNNVTQECIQPAQRPIPGDLPLARRASLHRFLEKRKDRITTRAPYQISGSAASPSKRSDSKSWLALAAQSLQ